MQKNYTAPFLVMVFLFLIVGFLTTANTQFQAPLQQVFLSQMGTLRNTCAALITFSWFLAYPLCGGIGAKIIDRHGYKAALLCGLMIMFAGLVIFWFSAKFTVGHPDAFLAISDGRMHVGFLIFLLGSFTVGASATILQVVINPYLSACHVPGTQGVQRMAMGGSANALGTTLAPYFVTGVVFSGLQLTDVRVDQLVNPFACLAGVIALVYLMLRFFTLPDIEGYRANEGETLERSVWSFRHLKLGVIAIFCYVGVEVCVGSNINMYALECGYSDPALMATLYWGGILVGRLVGSTLRSVSPRTQLTATTVLATVLAVCAVATGNPWFLAGIGLAHSIMWGAIFTLSVAGLGKYTSVASGVFMIGVVGGAIFPLLQGALADTVAGWRWSWAIVIFGELFMLWYARSGSRPLEIQKTE